MQHLMRLDTWRMSLLLEPARPFPWSDVNALTPRAEWAAAEPADPDAWLPSLAEFCVDSVSTCLSRHADRRCVPVGLSSLSALFLLLSCLLIAYEWRRSRRETAGEASLLLYSLLGHVCAAVGASLTRQLHIQVLMAAVAAALDAARFLSWCFPVLLCWNTTAERRLRTLRRRRRQHLLAGCGLMLTAGLVPFRLAQIQTDRPLNGRRLMETGPRLRPDSTDILSYTLGLLSLVIACTSRFPVICQAYRGHKWTRGRVISWLLCALAGALYAAAILLYDTGSGFVLRVLPWLMSAVCGAVLDLLIAIIYWLKKGAGHRLAALSSDTESLLGCSAAEDKALGKTQGKQRTHGIAQIKKSKNAQKMTDICRYLDVSGLPSGKLHLDSGLSGEGQLNGGKFAVVSAGSLCSSDTSFDSSISSELEWDFEEENVRWNKLRGSHLLPLQQWPKKTKLLSNVPTSFLQKTLSGMQGCESFSSESLIQ